MVGVHLELVGSLFLVHLEFIGGHWKLLENCLGFIWIALRVCWEFIFAFGLFKVRLGVTGCYWGIVGKYLWFI